MGSNVIGHREFLLSVHENQRLIQEIQTLKKNNGSYNLLINYNVFVDVGDLKDTIEMLVEFIIS